MLTAQQMRRHFQLSRRWLFLPSLIMLTATYSASLQLGGNRKERFASHKDSPTLHWSDGSLSADISAKENAEEKTWDHASLGGCEWEDGVPQHGEKGVHTLPPSIPGMGPVISEDQAEGLCGGERDCPSDASLALRNSSIVNGESPAGRFPQIRSCQFPSVQGHASLRCPERHHSPAI